ncbi:MAG: HD domain-containing phosphohydrolase [Myxococcota bacterium]
MLLGSGAWLDVVDEGGARRAIPLGDAVQTLGRARDNTVTFPRSEGVSRYHAEILFNDGEYLLVDKGSSGGTFVNDQQVHEHILSEGDTIQLGRAPAPILTFRGEATRVQTAISTDAADDPMTVMRAEDTRFLNPALLAQVTKQGAEADRALAGRMQALYQITSALLSVSSTDELCTRLLDLIFEAMPGDRGAILLRRAKNGDVTQRASKCRTASDGASFVPSRTVTGRVLGENVAVLSMDAALDDRFSDGKSLMMQAVRSVICAPLSSQNNVWGVCYLDCTMARKGFEHDDLEFLLAVCRQAGMALENLHLLEEQRKTFESMIRTLAFSIDARDEITAGHSSRVAKYSQAIARYMGLPPEECRLIWYAGLLHDYGKIGTREAILCKPGKLTDEEYEHIKEHPGHTYKILSKINFSDDMADLPRIAASHHERPDGKGYPFGWKGDEIPLGGRIIAVADFFDALTVKRHYREPMPLKEVVGLMEQGRDTQFDGRVLDAFLEYFRKEYVPLQKRRSEKKSAQFSDGDETATGPASAKPRARSPA